MYYLFDKSELLSHLILKTENILKMHYTLISLCSSYTNTQINILKKNNTQKF